MADPLSIASGIAGLLSFGVQVTQTLVDFYSAYKDQDTNLSRITQNLESLQSIFRSLDVAIQDRRSRADAQELFKEVEKATQRYEEIINELQFECQNSIKAPSLVSGAVFKLLGVAQPIYFEKSYCRSSRKTLGRYVRTYYSH